MAEKQMGEMSITRQRAVVNLVIMNGDQKMLGINFTEHIFSEDRTIDNSTPKNWGLTFEEVQLNNLPALNELLTQIDALLMADKREDLIKSA